MNQEEREKLMALLTDLINAQDRLSRALILGCTDSVVGLHNARNAAKNELVRFVAKLAGNRAVNGYIPPFS